MKKVKFLLSVAIVACLLMGTSAMAVTSRTETMYFATSTSTVTRYLDTGERSVVYAKCQNAYSINDEDADTISFIKVTVYTSDGIYVGQEILMENATSEKYWNVRNNEFDDVYDFKFVFEPYHSRTPMYADILYGAG